MKTKLVKVLSICLAVTTIFAATSFAQGVTSAQKAQENELNTYQTMEITLTQPQKDVKSKIIVTDSNGKKIPFLLNKNTDKSYLILPVYDNSEELTVKVNLNPKEYTLKNTEQVVYLQNEENLEKLRELSTHRGMNSWKDGVYDAIAPSVESNAVAEKKAAGMGGQSNSDYSKTNAQVQGVDESDIVQTDGTYIYYISEDKVNIAKTANGKISIQKPIHFSDDFYPMELYAEKNKLIVIGVEHGKYEEGSYKEFTVAIIYDMSNPNNPKQIRKTAQEGVYVSSRKDGDTIRLVTQDYIWDWGYIPVGSRTSNDAKNSNKEFKLPSIKETLGNGQAKSTEISLDKVMVFPGMYSEAYVIISSFPTNGHTPAKQISYLGNAENLYMSKDTMAISYTDWRYDFVPYREDDIAKTKVISEKSEDGLSEKVGTFIAPRRRYTVSTVLKRFAIKGTDISYVGSNAVHGTLINQFAMDEDKGILRVAYTTDNNMNAVATFDKQMNSLGSLEGLAKGERIYSVRFMGDKLYLVTFRQVDPFFVIDMKNPKQPTMLGYLKIPGYSSYLHPVDDTHILGFGNDVTVTGESVRNAGVKIAMFDVSDVKQPKQISNVIIGEAGTRTPLSYDHKALLYNAAKNYFGFPVEVAKQKKENNSNSWPTTQTVFQGAYIYNIMPDFKLQLKGTVTHVPAGKEYAYEYNKNIQRLLYIGDVIYTVSPESIYANRSNDMKLIQSVSWQ